MSEELRPDRPSAPPPAESAPATPDGTAEPEGAGVAPFRLEAWLALVAGLAALVWAARSLAYRPDLLLDVIVSATLGLGLLAWSWPRLPQLRPSVLRGWMVALRDRLREAAEAAEAPAPGARTEPDTAPEAAADPATATGDGLPNARGAGRAGGEPGQAIAAARPRAIPGEARAFRPLASVARGRQALLLMSGALSLALLGQLRLDAAAKATRALPLDGLLLMLLAVGLWLLGLQRSAPEAPPDPPAALRPGPALGPRRLRLLALGLGLVLSTALVFPALLGDRGNPLALMRYGSAYDNSITPVGGLLWLVGSLLCLWALADRAPLVEAWRGLRGAGARLCLALDPVTIGLLLVMLLGAWLRFRDLPGLPYEMTSDHTEKLKDIRSIVEGLRPAFLPGNAGREAAEFYWIALLVRLGLPLSFDTMKLGMGLVSLATLPLIYLLGRELAGRWAGLAAALVAAAMPWHLQITRAALRIGFAPLFAALVLWLCLRALRLGGRNAWLALGLAAGLGVYGYTAYRPVLLAVPLIVAAKLLHDAWHEGRLGRPSTWLPRPLLAHLAAAATAGLLTIVPMLRYAADWPDYFNGRSRSRLVGDQAPIDQFWPLLRQNLSEQLLPNVRDALLMFNFTSDDAWFQSPPGRPALETVGAALFVLGLATVLFRLRQREWRGGLLVAVLPLMLVTSILALAFPRENPSLSRASAALPIAAVLAGLPPAALLPVARRAFGRRGLLAAGLALGLLAAGMLRGTEHRYFEEYRAGYDNSTHSTRQGAEVARGFLALGGDLEHVYYVGWVHGWDYRALAWLLDAPDWANILQGQAEDWSDAADPARTHLADPARKLYLLGGPHAERHLELLGELFPTAIVTYHQTRVPGKEFWSVYVPGQAAGAAPESSDDG